VDLQVLGDEGKGKAEQEQGDQAARLEHQSSIRIGYGIVRGRKGGRKRNAAYSRAQEDDMGMDRRHFLTLAGATAAAAALPKTSIAAPSDQADQAAQAAPLPPFFELDEVTVDELQQSMRGGQRTARSIAETYLARIAAIDKRGPAINAIIELNPDALDIADALDRERKGGHVRGPLHGIPVVIKDNIDTADRMKTSAGSLALAENVAARDAFVARRLREAGAVILGKTNLSEWANFRSTHSTSGWSGRGGLTRNPYALDRNCCGSSSGTGAAVAANLAAVGIGTETDGSVVCPSPPSSASSRPSASSAAPALSLSPTTRTPPGRCAAASATPPSFSARSAASTTAIRSL
jgi:amidase